MQRYTFKEGEPVRHLNMLEQKMAVSQIKRQNKKVPTGKMIPDPNTGEQVFEKKDKMFFIGIECQWWDKDGKFHKEIFHSRYLIPEHFALREGKINKDSIAAFLGQ